VRNFLPLYAPPRAAVAERRPFSPARRSARRRRRATRDDPFGYDVCMQSRCGTASAAAPRRRVIAGPFLESAAPV